MVDVWDAIPFTHYRQFATPVRFFIAGIIVIQFFNLFEIPSTLLYTVAVLAVLHLVSIGFEKAKLSTVEIAERRCRICDKPMYSKVIKCEKCKITIDTDEERGEKTSE